MGYEKWSFNGFDLTEDGKWDVEEVLEGLGMPKYRGSDIQVPFLQGTRWVKKRFDRRKLVLSMWIAGTDRENLDANIDLFLRGVGRMGIHPIQRTMRSGEIRNGLGEVVSEINFVTKNPGYAKFAFELEMPDPFFYGETLLVDEQAILLGSHEWVHTNLGSAPNTKMEISLIGPLSSPSVRNMGNAVWFQYMGEIPEGQTVVLKTNSFSCMNGEDNLISALQHGGDAYWMLLESGMNTLKLETSVTGGSIKIEYYPPYF